MRELATIVIPVFGAGWRPDEYTLLQHARKELAEFSFVFLCPDNTDTGMLSEQFPGCTIYKFDARFFVDRTGYTQLLLSADLYETFGWSEYILLFEPCTYIVKNELRYWCKQGHDYIPDTSGYLSLRNVDRFMALTRRGARSIHRFLSGAATHASDALHWQRKAAGIWPSLRSPTKIVSGYFSLALSPDTASLPLSRLPFALTEVDLRSEEHTRWIERLAT